MRLGTPSFAAFAAIAALAPGCGDSRISTHPLTKGDTICVSCHGGQDNQTGAPPFDLDGASDTAEATVGAHSAHVQATLARPFACGECHEVVPQVITPLHIDGKIDLPFGSLSRTGGASPSFDPGTLSCSTTYCHGATLQGGSHTTPTWNKVGQGEAACGNCHGLPPAQLPSPSHPAYALEARCAGCHPATADTDAAGNDVVLAGGGLHVDGKVEYEFAGHPAGWYAPGTGGDHTHTGRNPLTGGCATADCHGTDLGGGRSGVACARCHDGATAQVFGCATCHGGAVDQTGAPPIDTHEVSATTSVTVGAHTSHVQATHGLSAPLDCGSCHVKPTSVGSPGHIDGPTATVVLSASGTWDRGGATCASTYCHGNFTGGNLYNVPRWTTVNGTQAACGTCHGVPPLTGQHDFHVNSKGFACNACHPMLYSAATVDPATHVNGAKDVPSNIANWNPATKTCNASCHTTMPNPAPWYF
jgi:predicted CxxxxCH...CXXCH cytochrome family protein